MRESYDVERAWEEFRGPESRAGKSFPQPLSSPTDMLLVFPCSHIKRQTNRIAGTRREAWRCEDTRGSARRCLHRCGSWCLGHITCAWHRICNGRVDRGTAAQRESRGSTITMWGLDMHRKHWNGVGQVASLAESRSEFLPFIQYSLASSVQKVPVKSAS